jgi:hypothetical protein
MILCSCTPPLENQAATPDISPSFTPVTVHTPSAIPSITPTMTMTPVPPSPTPLPAELEELIIKYSDLEEIGPGMVLGYLSPEEIIDCFFIDVRSMKCYAVRLWSISDSGGHVSIKLTKYSTVISSRRALEQARDLFREEGEDLGMPIGIHLPENGWFFDCETYLAAGFTYDKIMVLITFSKLPGLDRRTMFKLMEQLAELQVKIFERDGRRPGTPCPSA